MTVKQTQAMEILSRYSKIRNTLNQRYDVRYAWAFTPPEIHQTNDWFDRVVSYLVEREYRELKKVMEEH